MYGRDVDSPVQSSELHKLSVLTNFEQSQRLEPRTRRRKNKSVSKKFLPKHMNHYNSQTLVKCIYTVMGVVAVKYSQG